MKETDKNNIVRAYDALLAEHSKVTKLVGDLEIALKSHSEATILVDACWLVRNMQTHCEDMRKMLWRVEQTMIYKACMLWLKSDGKPIRGNLATGSPDVKDAPVLPSRSADPEKYDSVLREIGIPESIIAAGGVRFHYEGMAEYITQLQREGRPIPEFLENAGKTYPVYKLRLVASRNNQFV